MHMLTEVNEETMQLNEHLASEFKILGPQLGPKPKILGP